MTLPFHATVFMVIFANKFAMYTCNLDPIFLSLFYFIHCSRGSKLKWLSKYKLDVYKIFLDFWFAQIIKWTDRCVFTTIMHKYLLTVTMKNSSLQNIQTFFFNYILRYLQIIINKHMLNALSLWIAFYFSNWIYMYFLFLFLKYFVWVDKLESKSNNVHLRWLSFDKITLYAKLI